MSTLPLNRLLMCCALALVAACKPPSLEDVQKEAAQNVSALLLEAYDAAVASTENSQALAGFMDAVNVSNADLGHVAQPRPSLPSSEATAADRERAFESVKQLLNERVFTKQNVESTGLGDVTFLIDGARFCAGANGQLSDPNCVKMVDDLQARLVVSGDPHATLTIRLLLGKARRSPAVLTFENGRALQLELDVAEYQAVVASLPASLNAPVTSRSEGLMRYRLEKLGPADFAVSYSVLRGLRTSVQLQTASRTWSSSWDASDPTYRLHYNGRTGVHEVTVNVARLTWDGVWGDYSGTTDTTPVHAEFPGFTANFTTDVAPALMRGTVALPRGVVTVGGQGAFSASLARPVSLALTRHTDGRLKLELSDVELDVGFHFARTPLAQPDRSVADATYKLRFAGGNALALTAVKGALAARVLSGTLSLEVPEAGRSLTAPSGQCVLRSDTSSPAEFPLFRELRVGDCY